MAGTTLAEVVKEIGDYVARELLWELFVEPDPLFARIPLVATPGGLTYTQRYKEEVQSAVGMAVRDSFTLSAMRTGEYKSFVRFIGSADDSADLVRDAGIGQQGLDPKLNKKMGVLEAVSTKAREQMVAGDEATYAIGSNLTTLGITAVEPGGAGTLFDYEDIHDAAGVTAKNIAFKWTAASKELQVKMPGDSAYGPAVTLSSTRYHRVPLFSGGSSGDKNSAKWCYVTVTWSTISAASDFDSDTGGTSADYVVATPNKLPNGFLRKVHPDHRIFTNLETTDSPPAAGGPLDQDNLTWLAQKLLDASNERPSNCAILVDPTLWISANAVVRALGMKAENITFLGQEIMALSFGGIPILRSSHMPTNISSPDGSVTNLRRVLGVVIGEQAAHMRYMDLGANNAALAAKVLRSRNTLIDAAGTQSLPIAYLERDADSQKMLTYQQAIMAMDPVVARLDSLAMIDNVTA